MDTYNGVALGVESAWPGAPVERTSTKRRWPIVSAGLAVIAALVLLAGCASVDCGPDWYAVGERDGVLGASAQEANYAARCGAVDAVRYREGFQEGFSRRPRPTV